MEKRHQIFVSSTFSDLREERSKVIQTLMEMDCIPSGMELFPAADEEQFAFIKRVIDDCDYYILIIGSRYGSQTLEGVSYTEKEYDYAIEKGLKVLAFIHERPEEIPSGKTDLDSETRKKLAAFREKASSGRLVKFWRKADELPGLVALSLSKTIKTYPAVGWVRGDQIASAQLLTEIHELRKQNEALSLALAEYTHNPAVENLADLDESVSVGGSDWARDMSMNWEAQFTWSSLFALIAPFVLEEPEEGGFKGSTAKAVYRSTGRRGYYETLDEDDFQTLKVQYIALGLVEVKLEPKGATDKVLRWSLTQRGRALLMQLRTVKKAS